MAAEHRRIAAESAAHAQGVADNMIKQGYAFESQTTAEWLLRKKRRRGDLTVTIAITQPSLLQSPPPADWAPPRP